MMVHINEFEGFVHHWSNGEGINGLYVEQADTSSDKNRGYYIKGSLCIWWHDYGHWWIGSCFNRASSGPVGGYAYLAPDVLCPNQAKSGWRRGGSDQALTGYVKHTRKSLGKKLYRI